MTLISNNNIARAIYLALKDKTNAEQSLIFPKIVKFLMKKRLLSKAGDILLRLDKIINDDQERIIVKISSSEKIGETTQKELVHSLSKRYGNKAVILAENLNEQLLGGYKVEVNDEVIDLTLKNRIGKLQEHLIKSI